MSVRNAVLRVVPLPARLRALDDARTVVVRVELLRVHNPAVERVAREQDAGLAVLAVLRDRTGEPVPVSVLHAVLPEDVALGTALRWIRDRGIHLEAPGFVRPCYLLP